MVAIATMLCTCRPEVRREYAGHLAHHPDIRLVDEAFDAAQTLNRVKLRRPDVLVMDADLGGMSSLPLIPRIRSISRATAVLIIHPSCRDEFVGVAMEYGAAGCLARTSTADEVRRAVIAVHSGEIWAHRRLLAHLLHSVMAELRGTDDHSGTPLGSLTSRELEIVLWLRQGLTNKEIAKTLGISDTTVKSHVQHIFSKLHVSRRMKLLIEPSAAESIGDDPIDLESAVDGVLRADDQAVTTPPVVHRRQDSKASDGIVKHAASESAGSDFHF